MRATIVFFLLCGAAASAPERLWVAEPLTAEGSFTGGIEGPATDREGNIYAVSFARQNTIGKVTPQGAGEVFVEMPGKSLANGIRFLRPSTMFVADYVGHNILAIDMATRAIRVFAHEDRMNQPNDIAITREGVLYASDPGWSASNGQVWMIDTAGKVQLAARNMGTTNGIEVSPNGRTLYVNETAQRKVWTFRIAKDGSLADKKLLIEFPAKGMDGMRCDVDGNLYITRPGAGTVVKVSPKGKVLHEIPVLGSMPTNLCFGGPDGRTCYVTEVEHKRLVQFRVDRPGLEWKRWR